MLSVIGEIVSPRHAVEGYTISHRGQPVVVTRSGGITYNVRVGDRAIGWASDHTEPGVSIRNRDEGESAALAVLSCVGNDAFVVTGEGKGSRGTVTGKHGGNQLLVDFTREVMETAGHRRPHPGARLRPRPAPAGRARGEAAQRLGPAAARRSRWRSRTGW